MTPRAEALLNALRANSLSSREDECPVCGGHINTDLGSCDDCGADFDRQAALMESQAGKHPIGCLCDFCWDRGTVPGKAGS